MRIQTLNSDYEILRMAESGERLDVLIARDEKHPEKGKCMLVVLKQRTSITSCHFSLRSRKMLHAMIFWDIFRGRAGCTSYFAFMII